jgi:hypothetical protein
MNGGNLRKIADSAAHTRLFARKIVCNGRQSCPAARVVRLPAAGFGFSRALNTLCLLQNVWNSLHDDKNDCIFDPWAENCPRSSAFDPGSSRLRAKRSGQQCSGEDTTGAAARPTHLGRTGTGCSREDASGRYRHNAGEPGYGHYRA